jgi:hypothetical protein
VGTLKNWSKQNDLGFSFDRHAKPVLIAEISMASLKLLFLSSDHMRVRHALFARPPRCRISRLKAPKQDILSPMPTRQLLRPAWRGNVRLLSLILHCVLSWF